ncbi:hypothetical protein Pint_00062 [Pistacia integerrima]|uniref:Uncharacterized protein n=1 Tax=Pistacia integerrima TaxID=434235 RepID=A0ACC0ZPY6_9ROSI|nr:hypothetical protein Pint_00062 [Pistacia integerrima]
MARRQTGSELGRFAPLILFFLGGLSCFMVYLCFLATYNSSFSESGGEGDKEIRCCRGIQQLELWGDAVKWGSQFKVNSSEDCCMACKDMCRGVHGHCPCNSWVFCGDKQVCGSRFGECWLKKQNDLLEPDRRDAGDAVMWTSGLVFGQGEGIVGLETEYGILRVKLLPESAPISVAYILELLALRQCPGCQFYRAESRGASWDSKGNHIAYAPFGPPHALIQGTLEAEGTIFKEIPAEFCRSITRGSVAWVGSGPDFFISLANHHEWKKSYSVFGSVLPEDMEIAEKIAHLPTKPEFWSNVKVAILQKTIPIRFQRVKTSHGNLKLNTNMDTDAKLS